MKYFKALLISIFSLTLLVDGPNILAQTNTTDNESIQQRLEDEGLDDAPDVIEVDEPTMSGTEPSSGYVDENGNTLSDGEYQDLVAYYEEGFFKRNPWVLPVLVAVAAGGVFAAMKRKKQESITKS